MIAGQISRKRRVDGSCIWKVWLRIIEVTDGGYMFRYPEHYRPRRRHGRSPMRPRTIGPKLLIIAATALAITIAGSAEAEHDHGRYLSPYTRAVDSNAGQALAS